MRKYVFAIFTAALFAIPSVAFSEGVHIGPRDVKVATIRSMHRPSQQYSSTSVAHGFLQRSPAQFSARFPSRERQLGNVGGDAPSALAGAGMGKAMPRAMQASVNPLAMARDFDEPRGRPSCGTLPK
jgi:hypothetical protein